MNKLVFRADGNAQIGMGHVMRCLALADMLKDDFRMRFALVDPTPAVCSLIENSGLSIINLPASSQQADFLAQIEPDEIAVLDGYAFDQTFQQSVRSRARKLVFIDDMVRGIRWQMWSSTMRVAYRSRIMRRSDTHSYTWGRIMPCFGLSFSASRIWPTPANGPIFVSLGGADPQNTSAHGVGSHSSRRSYLAGPHRFRAVSS